ncbi:MAG: PhzF family phenazine biosynthesis protein [Kordiimonadaceae bacterium]|nr:PhzF family phenazine biosynthesis protein [Kordiimonadaceae bacterium]MBT6036953.1 PhzF family phenazine biosynthesis protein [Kordiimonadaceae bacterium]MBT6330006.1 PhzF family phenazine biosynthesis protein [Kordiimonadaceae bacterium]MBT7582088.1 PhzF family phenazine biosynthesis protein [Kordiimonadaceae bacterium]
MTSLKENVMTHIDREPNIEVQLLNSFTYKGEGGNPAGVVLDADRFSTEQKQQIAKAAAFPETAFVSNSDVADYKLEFFTPNKQIAHCGHATVAAFSYLSQIGKITKKFAVKETIDGNRDIILEDGYAYIEQIPQYFKDIEGDDVLTVMNSLSLELNDLAEGFLPKISNTGVSFLIIPLNSNKALAANKTDLEAIKAISDKYDLIGFYAFTTDPIDKSHSVTTRMFAPRYGINEESATGMAAGNLSAYLFEHMDFKCDKIIIEQGFFMPVPSKSEIIVTLSVQDGRLVKLMAGGVAMSDNSKFVNIG